MDNSTEKREDPVALANELYKALMFYKAENERLRSENARLTSENIQLLAYANGVSEAYNSLEKDHMNNQQDNLALQFALLKK